MIFAQGWDLSTYTVDLTRDVSPAMSMLSDESDGMRSFNEKSVDVGSARQASHHTFRDLRATAIAMAGGTEERTSDRLGATMANETPSHFAHRGLSFSQVLLVHP